MTSFTCECMSLDKRSMGCRTGDSGQRSIRTRQSTVCHQSQGSFMSEPFSIWGDSRRSCSVQQLLQVTRQMPDAVWQGRHVERHWYTTCNDYLLDIYSTVELRAGRGLLMTQRSHPLSGPLPEYIALGTLLWQASQEFPKHFCLVVSLVLAKLTLTGHQDPLQQCSKHACHHLLYSYGRALVHGARRPSSRWRVPHARADQHMRAASVLSMTINTLWSMLHSRLQPKESFL